MVEFNGPWLKNEGRGPLGLMEWKAFVKFKGNFQNSLPSPGPPRRERFFKGFPTNPFKGQN